MEATINYGLKKPAYEDGADIAVLNQNADKVDAELKKVSGGTITTLSCTKTGTVYALTGLSATAGIVSCVFKADADYAVGDTFTVDGKTVTATLQNGDCLDGSFFKAGAAVPFVYDVDGAKLNFKSGGSPTPTIFGDGSDGDAVISSSTTLPVAVPHQSIVEKNYKSLTINSGVTLKCATYNAGLILRVKGDCTIHGTIDQSGLAPKTNYNNNYPYPSQLKCGSGGDGGRGGGFSDDVSGVSGGTSMLSRSYGGGYGAGGGGGFSDYSGAGAGGDSDKITIDIEHIFIGGNADGKYGGGGCGGGNAAPGGGGNGPGGNGGSGASIANAYASGGGGGAGNCGGGIILLYVGGSLFIDGRIKCNGLDGGNGGSHGSGYGSGGSGGGGGGGGAIYICHRGTYTNTGLLQVNGGSGGSGGSGGNIDSYHNGNHGCSGSVGSITVIQA